MAGEWIPIDCNLGTKPEVLELVDETGEPVEVVVYRLIQLWSWASMNTADGTIRTTPARLAAVAGGDEAFWLAVERVGWVSFLNGTIVIEGWERRFSRAAKARAENARRACAYRARKARPQDSTGEDNTEEEIPAAPVPTSKPPSASGSRAKPAVSWSADYGWQGITDADRSEWGTAFPGAALDQELAKASAWLKANPQRAGRRNWRRFLVGWLQRCQDKGGTNREPGNRPAGPPPVDPARRRFYRSDAGRNMTDAT
ncbi:MAG: hypothetical protein EB078_05275 [Proteobacteria bacterium]|nr:hypothetical protein [Pseudomonadota bacterium]